MAYRLKGSLLEVCTCKILCPCWVGEDPDFGDCKSAMAWHFDEGEVDGIEIGGRTVALAVFIPGNVLDGNWRVTMFIDDGATDEQAGALQAVYSGEKGGPIVDLISLVGEVTSVERVPIVFTVKKGKGTLVVGDVAEARLEPYRGPTGEVTTLSNTIFSTVPGSPAYAGKAENFRLNSKALGIDLDIQGHNAIQSDFLMEHAG